MWMQGCSKAGISIDFNMIQEKAKSCDNLKQRKLKDGKMESLMPAKDGLIILERGLA